MVAEGFAKAEELESEMGFVPNVEGNFGKLGGVEAIWVERTEVAPTRLGTVVVEDRNDVVYHTLLVGIR